MFLIFIARCLFFINEILKIHEILSDNWIYFTFYYLFSGSGYCLQITAISFITLSWYEFYEILYNSMDLYEERNIVDMKKVFWIFNIACYILYILQNILILNKIAMEKTV